MTENKPPTDPPPSDPPEPIDITDEDRTALADLHDDPAPEILPDAIGPYRVLDHLGRGGFGTVYLCQETEPPRRKLALKVIRAGMDTRDVLARFEAEKNALSMMNHPTIARVIDKNCVSCKLCEQVCIKDAIIVPRPHQFEDIGMSFMSYLTDGH